MTKKPRMSSKGADAALPSALKESAQQIWSVGVGAITRAQQQSNRVFEALVREGETLRENLQKKTRSATSVSEVTARATDTWDKLEQVFEKRVARALSSLGVPTRRDMAELSARIDTLTALIETQNRKPAVTGAVKARPARKTVKAGGPDKPAQ